jgi:aerobic carbon-monoxide dehydrogenase large subunit
MNSPSGIGAPVPRREDARLVTGTGRYLGDLAPAGLVHGAFARTSVAHGLLERVSVEEARHAAGVVAAFTAEDLQLHDIPASSGRGPDNPAFRRPPLARSRVRYAGEAVAVVVAESVSAATDAVEHVDIDVEPLRAVTDPHEALTGEVLLFPEAGTNVVDLDTPGGEELERWPVQATIAVDNQRLAPVPVEPLGVLAVPGDDGSLTVWCGHQAPHRLRRHLALLLGLPAEQIRVIVPEVGGGFGLRGMLFPEYAVVAAVARRLGRPVRWIQTRSEQFLGGTHGRGMRHRVRLAGDRDGRIRAAAIDLLADVGAYPHNGTQVPMFARLMATGTYHIPETVVRSHIVVTNQAPVGSYRGAGRPEAAYAIERAVEAFARECGLDPIEVRRRNLLRPDQLPYRTPTGALYDSGDYPRALETALEAIDSDAVRKEQRRRLSTGERPLGLGIGCFVERAGGAPDSTEYARVEVTSDGRLLVRIGTAATGQGHETAWSQVLADVFSTDPTSVEVLAGDTGEVREGTGTFGSRSAQIGGSAIQRTGMRAREQCLAVAADLLEATPEDLRVADGRITVAGDPSASVSLRDVAAHAAATGVDLAAEESYSPNAQTFPYGVVAAVVEVDTETGAIDLRRLVAVDDCGTVLNPMLVEGQVHGSLAQGIGQALYEGVVYTEDGQLLTSTLIDYLVPTAPDLPPIETGRLVTPAPSNPLGAKGTGESGCIGAPPAIVNAVIDALAPYGVTDLSMPLAPSTVWQALQKARGLGPAER